MPEAFAKSGRIIRLINFPSGQANLETYSGQLATWLFYNGYDVEFPTYSKNDGRKRVHIRPSAVRILVAIRALKIARNMDTIIMIAGDEHYGALASGLKRMGQPVVVVSTLLGSSPLIAIQLRRQADAFIDYADLMSSDRRSIDGPANRALLRADPP